MELFDAEIPSWEEYILPVDHALYDGVIFDSEVERSFALAIDQREDIRHFIKLPNWFKIPTPIGFYNPDWALVMDNPDCLPGEEPQPVLYLIAETKGNVDVSKLRFGQRAKRCTAAASTSAEDLASPTKSVKEPSDLPEAPLLKVDKGCV